MNLHRVGEKADYLNDTAPLTSIQEIAKATYGVVSPANAVTLSGLALTISGLKDLEAGDHNFKPIFKILSGRLLDIADGHVADYFKTKSSVGEAADSIADKIAAFYAFKVFYQKAEENVIPSFFYKYAVAQNSANSFITVSSKLFGKEVHSSFSGKISTATQWAAVLSYLIADTYRYSERRPRQAKLFKALGHTAAALTIGLGSKATLEMAGNLLTSSKMINNTDRY